MDDLRRMMLHREQTNPCFAFEFLNRNLQHLVHPYLRWLTHNLYDFLVVLQHLNTIFDGSFNGTFKLLFTMTTYIVSYQQGLHMLVTKSAADSITKLEMALQWLIYSEVYLCNHVCFYPYLGNYSENIYFHFFLLEDGGLQYQRHLMKLVLKTILEMILISGIYVFFTR